MTDYDDMVRGTAREWFWARIVLIGGFVVAMAVAGYFVWQRHEETIHAQEQAKAVINAKMGLAVCAMELASAQSMGIVPAFGHLTTAAPEATGRQGRYACTAATPSLKYIIAADLVCAAITNPKCVQVTSIKTDDGTMLYQQK
jgi:hypothetical protein